MRAEVATVGKLRDLLTYVAEDVSLGFDRWEAPYVRGPSLYFLIVMDVRFDGYADPLGANRWPVGTVRTVADDLTRTVEAAREVAFDCDGAVIVTADGTFQERMVRVRSPDDRGVAREYPDWMSAKNLSALEASDREEVLAAITLSEESGRVTVFEDGTFEDYERDELGGRWRAA